MHNLIATKNLNLLTLLDLVAIFETWFKDGDNVVVNDITPAGYGLKQVPPSKLNR